MKRVFLDANSNYGLLTAVREKISSMPTLGNPQSIHFYGQALKALIEDTREEIRNVLSADNFDIFFCSGATEAANWLSHSISQAVNGTKNLVVVSKVEHACVLESVKKFIETENIFYIPLDYRQSDLCNHIYTQVEAVLDRVKFFYWIHSHNETGVIFPLKELSQKLKSKKSDIFIVSDLVQSVFKIDGLDISFLDAWFFSGHKIGALPGVGVLGIKKNFPLVPFIVGGSQERYFRGGTENYQAIWSLKLAIDYWKEIGNVENTYRSKKTFLKNLLLDRFKSGEIQYFFEGYDTIQNTLHVVIQGFKSADLLVALDLEGICCSAGSSCYSGKPLPPALEGFGLPQDIAKGALRLSFRFDIMEEDLIYFADKLQQIIKK